LVHDFNSLNCWDEEGLLKDLYSSKISLYLKGSQKEEDNAFFKGPLSLK